MSVQSSVMDITPVTLAERALAEAKTPEEVKEVEAMAAAAMAWAKEQGDLELAFDAAVIYIRSRCYRTELIEPMINHGGDRGGNQYAEWQGITGDTLADYSFTKLQWNRRKKELEAFKRFGDYRDDCIEKGIYPTPKGLVGYYSKKVKEAAEERDRNWREQVELTEEELEQAIGLGLDSFFIKAIRLVYLEAADGDDEAKAWLLSDDCRYYCEILKRRHSLIEDWVDSGCPTTPIHLVLLNRFEEIIDEPVGRYPSNNVGFASSNMGFSLAGPGADDEEDISQEELIDMMENR